MPSLPVVVLLLPGLVLGQGVERLEDFSSRSLEQDQEGSVAGLPEPGKGQGNAP
jgi:hypothetical protein